MKKLVFISGPLGVGKSNLLDELKPYAKTVCVDELQREIGKRAFPYIAEEKYYWWWDTWPQTKERFDLVRLFRESLRSFCPDLQSYDGHLVVAGCILAHDWFRRPLKEAINQLCIRYEEIATWKLRLEIDFDTHLQQVHKRASEIDFRSQEARDYPDVAAIRRLQADHLRIYSYSWDSAAVRLDALSRVKQFLES